MTLRKRKQNTAMSLTGAVSPIGDICYMREDESCTFWKSFMSAM